MKNVYYINDNTGEIPGHVLTYSFDDTNACGATNNPTAGKNGNRTATTDNHTLADGTKTSTTTRYCYDNADRLTRTTITNPTAEPGQLAATNLTTTGPTPTLAYDVHGNTTTLADQTLTYDGTNRHISTVVAGGPTITYQRDAAGRVIKRTTGADTLLYTYGPGGLIAVLDGNKAQLKPRPRGRIRTCTATPSSPPTTPAPALVWWRRMTRSGNPSTPSPATSAR